MVIIALGSPATGLRSSKEGYLASPKLSIPLTFKPPSLEENFVRMRDKRACLSRETFDERLLLYATQRIVAPTKRLVL